MTAKVYCDLPFFRATASKHEVLPTLKVLRVRLKHRLFLFPLKSFCKQKSFGDTPVFKRFYALKKTYYKQV